MVFQQNQPVSANAKLSITAGFDKIGIGFIKKKCTVINNDKIVACSLVFVKGKTHRGKGKTNYLYL